MWVKPRGFGSYESVGCICHNDPRDLIKEHVEPNESYGGVQLAKGVYTIALKIWRDEHGNMVEYEAEKEDHLKEELFDI
jgi:hypothetical protein